MVSWDEAQLYENDTRETIIVCVLIVGYWKRVMSERPVFEILSQEKEGMKTRW